MKFEKNKQHTNIAIYAFIVIAAGILFYQAVANYPQITGWIKMLVGFIKPLIIGIILAYLLNPLLRFVEEKFVTKSLSKRIKPSTKRFISIAITYLVVIIILLFSVAIIVPQLAASIGKIFANAPVYLQNTENLYRNLSEQLSQFQLLNQGSEYEQIVNNIFDKLNTSAETMLSSAVNYLGQLVPVMLFATGKITTGVINAILGIIISIYLLSDREKLFAQLRKILTAILPQRTSNLVYEIAGETHGILKGYIVGSIIDSAIIGVLCFIGMSVLRMPDVVLISVIVGCTNIIPYFGPFIGAIPGAIIVFIANPSQTIWFLVFILILQQFDGNILKPRVIGNSIGLPALWVIFSIMLFGGFWGVIGFFVGVPLFAIFYMLTRRFIEFLLKKKGEPTSTRNYDTAKNKLLR